MNQDVISRIEQQYARLSKGQKRIADFIFSSYDRAAFITAARMGEIVGVSESTVVRFAYALNYEGYPALQKSLQEVIRTKLTALQRIELTSDLKEDDVLKSVLKADMHNIRATIDNIDNVTFQTAMQALLCAERVYVIGVRSANPLAQFLSYYLNYICNNVIVINGLMGEVIEQMIHINKNDICIGISFPRYSKRTVEAMHYAKEHGAATIGITDSMEAPLSSFVDYPLCARSDMASFADSLVAPLSLINAMIVFAGMARKEELMKHFTRLEEVWGSQQVYMTKDFEEKWK